MRASQPFILPLLVASCLWALPAWALTPQEELGKTIFFDQNLSINLNQSCASCHSPLAGWTGGDVGINSHGAVYEGSLPGRFGNRKPPSAAYATQSPILHLTTQGAFVGGNFWDGRATGEKLGIPAADQAQGPFLNPLEQAISSPADVIGKICANGYADDFTAVCGADACAPENVSASYDCVGYAVAAYEGSYEVNQFSSKFDAVMAGKAKFSKQEQQGLSLFSGKAKCSRCHTIAPRGKRSLFTDYSYDNVGMPKNPENPFYVPSDFNPQGAAWIDDGLGGFLNARSDYAAFARQNYGKHKVPTLRNVDKWDASLGTKIKAYGHNGYFKTLQGIVHYYNTRDVLTVCPADYKEAEALAASCWPLPENALNMELSLVGNLGLTDKEEAALVAFLTTLSDGYYTP
jgi:cytochrome c peroxidase